jgi:hypothetical protein
VIVLANNKHPITSNKDPISNPSCRLNDPEAIDDPKELEKSLAPIPRLLANTRTAPNQRRFPDIIIRLLLNETVIVLYYY